MAGIRPPDNAAPPHRRNRLKTNTVPYLFSVRNMFFSTYWLTYRNDQNAGLQPYAAHV